jgi:cytochrome P450
MSSAAHLPDHLARAVADPKGYADMETLHQTFAVIRRDHPFARAELPDYEPFWAACKFEDIQAIARQNDVFLSGLGALMPRALTMNSAEQGFRSIVGMNPPEHPKYRLLTQAWFAPKNLRKLEDDMRALARRYVDRMAAAGGELDFVGEIAVHYPLLVVMAILGVPDEDEPMMLRLTQEYFGNADEELTRRSARTPEEIRMG